MIAIFNFTQETNQLRYIILAGERLMHSGEIEIHSNEKTLDVYEIITNGKYTNDDCRFEIPNPKDREMRSTDSFLHEISYYLDTHYECYTTKFYQI